MDVETTRAGILLRHQVRELVFVRDITARKKAEEALKESKLELANIIDFLPDATLVINNAGEIIAWNKAIEAMTGVNASDMLGKGNYEYALPFYRERGPILIDLTLNPREEILSEYTSTTRRGSAIEGDASPSVFLILLDWMDSRAT